MPWTTTQASAGALVLALAIATPPDLSAQDPPPLQASVDHYDWRPTWSPDARQLAFNSHRDGNYDLYVIGVDGEGLRRLTDHPADEQHPMWSPDGRTIAFVSNRAGQWDIYTINADGTGEQRITSDPADERGPTWSPSGDRIAFWSNRDGNDEVYTATAAGNDWRRVTHDAESDLGPVWSASNPDRLAFYSDRDGDFEVYTVNTDGTDLRQITDNEYPDRHVTWSPDGTTFVFWSPREDAIIDLYAVSRDSGAERRVTHGRDYDYSPLWSPDGRQIAFDSRRDGKRGLYVMDADGTNPRKITNRNESEFVSVARRRSVSEAVRRYYESRLADGLQEYFTEPELYNLSMDFLDDGRVVDAYQLLEFSHQMFRDAPQAYQTLMGLGEFYESRQEWSAATAAYERALSIDLSDRRARLRYDLARLRRP